MEYFNDFSKVEIPEILYYSYYTLGPTTTSPYHSHSYYEFTYMYECDGLYMIDGKEYKVKQGDIFLFPPGCRHGEIIQNGQQFNIFVVGVEGVNFEEIHNFYSNFGQTIPQIDCKEFHKPISDCCEEIRKELQFCEIGYKQIIRSLIEKIIILLLRSKSLKNPDSNRNFGLTDIDYSNKKLIVEKIKHYMDFYYSSKISLEDIVQNVYLSPAYVIKIFREETGETPISYLIKVRMNKAKKLLLQQNLSLTEISQMVGYDDVVHFSKMFKKFTGFSPRQYSKSI